MALFAKTYGAAPIFNVRAVSAGNAAEMEVQLTALLAAASSAGENFLVDLELGSAGAGPQWQAWVATGSTAPSNAPAIYITPLAAFAALAGNPTEAALLLNARLATFSLTEVVKVVVAGSGVGPTYMAVAIAVPT